MSAPKGVVADDGARARLGAPSRAATLAKIAGAPLANGPANVAGSVERVPGRGPHDLDERLADGEDHET